MVFTLKLDDKLDRSCDHCNLFIACGKEELLDKLKNIYNPIIKRDFVKISPEEFRTIAKYLMFCSSVVALPTGGNFNKAVMKAVEEAGSVKNIRIWCYLTPDQRMILYQSHIVFLSCWGTGKTLLMISKAIEIANSEENVLFLVFMDGCHVTRLEKSLLVYDLEMKFKDYGRVHVKPVYFVNGENNSLLEMTEKYSHVMIDEMFDNFANLTEVSQNEIRNIVSNKTTVWLAISSSYIGIGANVSDDPSSEYKNYFPNFEVVQMKTPLRSTGQIFKALKQSFSHDDSRDSRIKSLNNKLLMESKMPPNITDGHPVYVILRTGNEVKKFFPYSSTSNHQSYNPEVSFGKVLQECFTDTLEEDFALIIIKDNLIERKLFTLSSMISCNCWEVMFGLAVIHALKSFGRPIAKIHSTNVSGKNKGKDWISEKKTEDLIVSQALSHGFDYEFVISIGEIGDLSRSSSRALSICINPILLLLPMVEFLRHSKHDCLKIISGNETMALKNLQDIIGISIK